jgi:hypothetical protein
VVDHAADAITHDIEWLDRLIDAERAGTRTPTGPAPAGSRPGAA